MKLQIKLYGCYKDEEIENEIDIPKITINKEEQELKQIIQGKQYEEIF